MVNSCGLCGLSVNYEENNIILFKVANIKLREFEGIEVDHNYVCVNCMRSIIND